MTDLLAQLGLETAWVGTGFGWVQVVTFRGASGPKAFKAA